MRTTRSLFSCRLQLLRADPEHHRPGAAEAQRLGGLAQAQQRAGGRPPTRGRQQHHDADVRWAATRVPGPPPMSQGCHPCPREPGFGVQSAGQRRRWWDQGRSHSRFMGSTKLRRCWCTGDQGSPELDLGSGEQQDMVRVVTRKSLMSGDLSSFTLSVVGPRVFSAGSWVLPGCGGATVLKVGALL